MYTYKAVVVRIKDGDTIVLDVDLGFHTWHRDQSFRLLGCNAIEKNKPGGLEALANLQALLPTGTLISITSEKPDKYGDRYDASVILPDGQDLVTLLIADGWAVPWDGIGTRPIPIWPRQTNG